MPPIPTYTWEQVETREGVYKELGLDHLRYITCSVNAKLKTALVNLSTGRILKPFSVTERRRSFVEAEPLTITFSND